MLDCEFTVVEGPYARRKFWQNFTVAGGKLDEKGQSKGWNISKSTFRAMVDSALGLDPKDESPAAKAEARHPGAEAARRHRVRGAHHGRAGVEPAVQGRRTSSPMWCCRASRNTQPTCAARRVQPDPVNAKPRKAAEAPAAQRRPGHGARPPRRQPHPAACRGPARTRQTPHRAHAATGPGLAQRLTRTRMTDDEWQAHVTHEAGEGDRRMARRKRKPASANPLFDHARSRGDGAERHQRFIVLASQRIAQRPDEPASQKLSMLLLGSEGLRGLQPRRRAASTTRTLRPNRYPTFALLLACAACRRAPPSPRGTTA